MVDYVNTEIVTYADSSGGSRPRPDDSLDKYYPNEIYSYQVDNPSAPLGAFTTVCYNVFTDLTDPDSGDITTGAGINEKQQFEKYCPYLMANTGFVKEYFNANRFIGPKNSNLRYCALECKIVTGSPPASLRDYLDSFIYVFDDRLDGSYYRLDYFLNEVYDNPDFYTNYEQTDIYFLYDIGQRLVENNFLSDLLNTRIGGSNLITVLFGTGFFVYIGWAITKWFLPL